LSIATLGSISTTAATASAPTPARRAAIRTIGGTMISPRSGVPGSVRWLSHHRTATTNGEAMYTPTQP